MVDILCRVSVECPKWASHGANQKKNSVARSTARMRVCECGYDKPNQMARHLRTCKVGRVSRRKQLVKERASLVQAREPCRGAREPCRRPSLVQERDALTSQLHEVRRSREGDLPERKRQTIAELQERSTPLRRGGGG